MYLFLIFTLLYSIVINAFCGRFLSVFGVFFLSNFFMIISFILSIVIFYETSLSDSQVFFKLSIWFDAELFSLKWGFFFDSITAAMLIIVTFISFLVHLFSVNYMEKDPHVVRFFFLLTLFTFFMILLVTADNFIQMFLGWEGVGIASFLLINFWFTRYQANKSAIKAICLNRIGDFFLVIALAAIFYKFNSFDYFIVFPLTEYFALETISFFSYKFHYLSFIMIFIFGGAVGKSAQLGLHVWLPDAMEGPTPVSALIHAATMVTAGVFILIRCTPFLEFTPYTKNFIIILGALTAFFAASVGLVQNDIKRIIAFSTCSQLGYMIFACGSGAYCISFFHLINHAFFKALLFLSAGAIIHSINDEQDIRRMGGMLKSQNLIYVTFVIGSLALMGFPFLTGFYSKDSILEFVYSSYTTSSLFSFWLGLITAFFTAFYSFRLLIFVFFFQASSLRSIFSQFHNLSIFVYIPLFLLSLGSLFFGYIFRDLIIGLGTTFWNGSLGMSFSHQVNMTYEYVPLKIKLLPLFFSFFGVIISIFCFFFFPSIYIYIRIFIVFFSKKWGFDLIYQSYFTSIILKTALKLFSQQLDRGFFELLGPLGFTRIIHRISFFFKNLHSSFLFHYLFVFLINLYILTMISWYLFFFFDFFLIFFFSFFFFKNGCTS